MHLLPTNGQDGQQEEVGNQRSGDKVEREVQWYESAISIIFELLLLGRRATSSRRYYPEGTQGIQDRIVELTRDVDGNRKWKENNDICAMVRRSVLGAMIRQDIDRTWKELGRGRTHWL